MLATLSTRKETTADIPFLAQIEYEASLPPFDHCFWEDLLEGTGTNTSRLSPFSTRTWESDIAGTLETP